MLMKYQQDSKKSDANCVPIPECYRPKLNDYVVWNGNVVLEGWVYFVSDEYITIEIRTIPKSDENVRDCSLHKNTRVCVLCFSYQWSELTYVKSRKSVHDKVSCDLAE